MNRLMARLTVFYTSLILVSLMFAFQSYARIDPETIVGMWLFSVIERDHLLIIPTPSTYDSVHKMELPYLLRLNTPHLTEEVFVVS